MGFITHIVKFDEPVNHAVARRRIEDYNFFGYHPAGYGGSLALVTKTHIEEKKCVFCTWRRDKDQHCNHCGDTRIMQTEHVKESTQRFNTTDVSKVWSWMHSDSCS